MWVIQHELRRILCKHEFDGQFVICDEAFILNEPGGSVAAVAAGAAFDLTVVLRSSREAEWDERAHWRSGAGQQLDVGL